MNYRKKVPEKWFKSGYLLLFVIVICGILIACSNPAGSSPPIDNRSTDNPLSDLRINDTAVDGDSPDFTAIVPNGIASATISFAKPVGSTASFRITGGTTTNFPDRVETDCTVYNVLFTAGVYTDFSITITSERDVPQIYYLTVYRLLPDDVDEITLDIYTFTLNTGATRQLTATVSPFDAENKTLTWSTSDSDVATVDSTGLVTAVGRGEADITATAASGVYVTATVTVLSTSNALTNLRVGGGEPIPGTSPFAAGVASGIASADITFTKPAGAIVVFMAGGSSLTVDITEEDTLCTVAGVAFPVVGPPGNSFTITITSESGSAVPYYLTVTRGTVPVTSITLKSGTITLDADGGKGYLNEEAISGGTLTADVQPSDATNQTVAWSASPTGVVSINASTGLITPLTPGTTTIRATATDGSGIYGEATIQVRSKDNSLSGLKVNGTDAIETAPDSKYFTAEVNNGVTTGTITFKKPAEATATFMAGSTPVSVSVSDDTDCTVSVSFPVVGSTGNPFTITITSESGVGMPYYLTVTQKTADPGSAEILISWAKLEDLVQTPLEITVDKSLGQPVIITLESSITGPYKWTVDGVIKSTLSSFTFDVSDTEVGKKYNIGVYANNYGGDAVTITIE